MNKNAGSATMPVVSAVTFVEVGTLFRHWITVYILNLSLRNADITYICFMMYDLFNPAFLLDWVQNMGGYCLNFIQDVKRKLESKKVKPMN